MKTLKIGISPSLSGKYHIQGIESFKGIKLWVKNLKQQNKPLKPDLFFYDNKSDPNLTKQIANRLITEDQVDILLGPYSSTLTLEFLKICKQHNRVLWNYGGSSNNIHDYGYEKIVSTITEASNYYNGVINLISEDERYSNKVAILKVKESNFAQNVANGAADFANDKGIESFIYEFNPGEINFSTHLEKLKLNKITNVLCVGSIFDDMNFCEYMIDKNTHRTFDIIATLAASTNEFRKRFGDDSESFISTSQWLSLIHI